MALIQDNLCSFKSQAKTTIVKFLIFLNTSNTLKTDIKRTRNSVEKAQKKFKNLRFVIELRINIMHMVVQRELTSLASLYHLPKVRQINKRYKLWAENFIRLKSEYSQLDTAIKAYLKMQQQDHLLMFYLFKYF